MKHNMMRNMVAVLALTVTLGCADEQDTGLDFDIEEAPQIAVVQLEGAGAYGGVVIHVSGQPTFEPQAENDDTRLLVQPTTDGMTVAIIGGGELSGELFRWTLAEGVLASDYEVAVLEAVRPDNQPVVESALPRVRMR
jgi:hypothetical protein